MSKPALKINLDSLKARKDWKRHEVNSGDNIYRVLPPFGEESNGYPYRRWVIAWLADPATGRRRPYASPYSFGEDACPVSEYAAAVEEKRKALEAELVASGASKEQIKEKLKPYGEILWTIKPKASFVYNACNKAGQIGLLELKKTAHDAMKKQMMLYVTDYGQDPTSLGSDSEDSGVWFNVTREGEGTNTEYSVKKSQTKKKTADGMVYVDDREALPQALVDSYESMAYDLNKLYKQLSYDELKEVLLMNLYDVYEKFPDARVDGFEPIQPELSDKQEVAPVKVTAAPKVTAQTNKVKIRLDDLDDEPQAPKVAKPVPAKTKAAQTEDDIFAYADSILDT